MRGLLTQGGCYVCDPVPDELLINQRSKTGRMRWGWLTPPRDVTSNFAQGQWHADTLRLIARDYVVESVAADELVLVVYKAGFLRLRPSPLHLLCQLRLFSGRWTWAFLSGESTNLCIGPSVELALRRASYDFGVKFGRYFIHGHRGKRQEVCPIS